MEKNPFEILGITPELVKKLDNEQLFKLVQSNYRFLQKIYHPDIYGNRPGAKRAQAMATKLNKAFEKLDARKDDESFLNHREQYELRLKRGLRKQIDDKDREMERLNRIIDSLTRNSVDFLLHYSENWESRSNGAPPSRGESVFFLKNITLGLNDVAVAYNLRHSALNFGKNFKEIYFDEMCQMHYRLLCRSKFSPVNFIRLLGTIHADDIDPIPLLDRKMNKATTSSGHHIINDPKKCGKMFDVQNTIEMDIFKAECVPYLLPALSENSYLFSLHLENNRSSILESPATVWLEGKIVKVSGASSENV